MKFVLFYELAPDGAAKIPVNFPAHSAWYQECLRQGKIITAGPLGNPPNSALSIFNTREEAEDFAQGDPFVLNGVVGSWRIEEWKAEF